MGKLIKRLQWFSATHLPHLPHRYAYYIKRGYGLSPLRSEKEGKAVAQFCDRAIRDYYANGWTDSKNLEVWGEALRLYKIYLLREKDWFAWKDFYTFVEENWECFRD